MGLWQAGRGCRKTRQRLSSHLTRDRKPQKGWIFPSRAQPQNPLKQSASGISTRDPGSSGPQAREQALYPSAFGDTSNPSLNPSWRSHTLKGTPNYSEMIWERAPGLGSSCQHWRSSVLFFPSHWVGFWVTEYTTCVSAPASCHSEALSQDSCCNCLPCPSHVHHFTRWIKHLRSTWTSCDLLWDLTLA